MHVGGTLEEIAAGEAAVWRGEHPERPFVLLVQQSQFDPTRAPDGQAHRLRLLPRAARLDGRPDRRDRAQIERFAPGFRDRILARHATRTARLRAPQPELRRRRDHRRRRRPAPALHAARRRGSTPTRRRTRASSSARPRRRRAAACTACAATTPRAARLEADRTTRTETTRIDLGGGWDEEGNRDRIWRRGAAGGRLDGGSFAGGAQRHRRTARGDADGRARRGDRRCRARRRGLARDAAQAEEADD